MGNQPMAAGVAAGVSSNNEEALKAFFAQVPEDQKARLQAAIDAVQTQRGAEVVAATEPTAAHAAEAAAPAAAPAAEAAAAPAEKQLTEEELANVKAAFDAIDKDKSGTIEAKEFKTAMVKLGMTMSDEDVGEVFKLFDINHDGRLQFDEYVKLITAASKAK